LHSPTRGDVNEKRSLAKVKTDDAVSSSESSLIPAEVTFQTLPLKQRLPLRAIGPNDPDLVGVCTDESNPLAVWGPPGRAADDDLSVVYDRPILAGCRLKDV
jgi:hypothetical protein